MKNSKRNLGTLSLSKLKIAKVGDINSLYGGSIPKESDNCATTDTCTYNCNGDTIDTQ
ncbi:hypothetical protein U8527_21825 [Kordia algicida OT-1]|uniref:Uncharacterized protein n=1 Tax=Kordia algicida OT-1 TaxID=391587 RepID=A9DQA7_9FLAO|nr:hypothetical protein [Kordia algicida]EDP96614.1 hypothetical protein KAOT1_15663 [Kordia algicida OT-1]